MTEAANEATPDQIEKEAKAAEQKAMRESLNAAKATLSDFTGSAVFGTLDETVQEAIKRLAKKASAPTGPSTTQGFLNGLFPEVGVSVDEFELFKETRMGRGEMRKKVFYAMKKAEKADVLWIRFDSDSESWTLDQIGGETPDNWTEADLPKVINRG